MFLCMLCRPMNLFISIICMLWYAGIDVSYVLHLHMRMLNTAAKLQHFLGHRADSLPDLVQTVSGIPSSHDTVHVSL